MTDRSTGRGDEIGPGALFLLVVVMALLVLALGEFIGYAVTGDWPGSVPTPTAQAQVR